MANRRTVDEIILYLLDYYRLVQPDADVKPGTVIRDLAIEGPSSVVGLLYDELNNVSYLQSLRNVSNSDLDKLAANYGIIRKGATASSGTAILTLSSIPANININAGDLIYANNGFAFKALNSLTISASLTNYYRSIASKYRNDLDYTGNKDQYAVEITVQATSPGASGNIGKYALNRTNIASITGVLNAVGFSGGSNQESDAAFRDRIFSTFSGSSLGTALGYRNTAISTTGVIDAYVVEPGDPLMTRDGTVVSTAADGTKTIISEGSGGAVDVVILGSVLVENIDTYIYRDKSNTGNASDPKNDVILVQIPGDEKKSIKKLRRDNVKAGTLPAQPASEILEVVGSLSGTNFTPKSTDSFGRTTGNYELIKDTGVYAGSPWGADRLHFISNQISLFEEDKAKGQVNGQDSLNFSDALEIPQVQQLIQITNENSTVSPLDRSIITLLHAPATNITRVFNATTGERYVVSNNNLDNTSVFNSTGRIKITGTTLPVSSDILQVDYSWVIEYDQYSDYDGKVNTTNERIVNDSIDWGYANLVRKEQVLLTENTFNTFFTGNTAHPVSSVIKVNAYKAQDATIGTVPSGVFTGRYSLVLTNLTQPIDNISNIYLKNTNTEIYNTFENNGQFSVYTSVFNATLYYNVEIILPTDSPVISGQSATVVFDAVDIYNNESSIGSFSGNVITIPVSNYAATTTSFYAEISYIANNQELFNAGVSSLPATRNGNGFILSNNTNPSVFTNNILRKENSQVKKNLSNQFYIDLVISSNEFSLLTSDVLTVIRLSDGKELWDSNNVGSIIVDPTVKNYQLIFNGYNAPVTGDNVLVIYKTYDIRRFQPFTYSNNIILSHTDNLKSNDSSSYYVNVFNLQSAGGLFFDIINPVNSEVLYTGSDGSLLVVNGEGEFSTFTVDFATIPEITSYKLKLKNEGFIGVYDIFSYDSVDATITIGYDISNINKNQVSLVRVLDGKDIWNESCVISGNKLIVPVGTANLNDSVYLTIFNNDNLKQAPTKLSINISDQTNNSGVISVIGNTLTKSKSIVFTASASGLRQNLAEATRKALGLKSSESIPTTAKLARITKLEKVETVSAGSEEVSSVLATYNLKNTQIQNNVLYSDDFIMNDSLGNLDFILPGTSNNNLNSPVIGDKLRITFYLTKENDQENISFTRNGTLYTNKTFSLISKIFVSSGFTTSQSTKITIFSLTQPLSGTRYKSFYDYTAPKINERITIRYNYNRLVSDVAFNIENNRPINADILEREGKRILVDATLAISLTKDYQSSQALVVQNVINQIALLLNADTLGGNIDNSDLINAAYNVDGVDRARVDYFNKTGELGQVETLTAQSDEYFAANTIIINVESK